MKCLVFAALLLCGVNLSLGKCLRGGIFVEIVGSSVSEQVQSLIAEQLRIKLKEGDAVTRMQVWPNNADLSKTFYMLIIQPTGQDRTYTRLRVKNGQLYRFSKSSEQEFNYYKSQCEITHST